MDGVPNHSNSGDGGKVVASQFWDTTWGARSPLAYSGPPVWHKVISKYLPNNIDWTVLEVGCIPGNFLVYFNKEFGYRPAGVDYVPQLSLVRGTLELNKVPPADLYCEDFFTFAPGRTYDVVFSAGFVEHFEDYMPAIRKHAELVRPGGFLVLAVPNFTHGQYLLRSIFDHEDLRRHRFEIMRPEVLSRAVCACGMDVLHAGPAGTFDFWIVNTGTGVRGVLAKLYTRAAKRVAAILKSAGLGNLPSMWFSPQVICVARKPPERENVE